MRVTGGEETEREAAHFVALLEPIETALVVALSGDLGAGKTTFAQGIAKALGVEGTVTSPTFIIEKVYQLEKQKFQRLIHIDAYRLNGAHELQVLGWDELLRDPQNMIVIEWPEKVAVLIPKNAIRIRFEIDGDGRIITIDGQKEN